MTKALLISEEVLKKYTLISDNMDGKYLATAIQAAQDVELDTLIGPALRSRLEQLVYDQTIYDDEYANYYNLLTDYVTPYLCWTVMAEIQPAINYKMTNSGVISNDDERKSRQDYKTNQLLIDQYRRYADTYGLKLKNYLCNNTQKFPEYSQMKDDEYAEDVNGSGIYLGDVPSRNNFWWL